MKDDPEGSSDYLSFCEYALNQGVVIGCYELGANGKIDKLIGANAIYMMTKETLKDIENLKVSVENFTVYFL